MIDWHNTKHNTSLKDQNRITQERKRLRFATFNGQNRITQQRFATRWAGFRVSVGDSTSTKSEKKHLFDK